MIKMTYEYPCSLCDLKHIESYQVHMHLGEIPRPHLPMGWHIIDNHIICNKHDFSIYDIIRLDDQHKKEKNSTSEKSTLPNIDDPCEDCLDLGATECDCFYAKLERCKKERNGVDTNASTPEKPTIEEGQESKGEEPQEACKNRVRDYLDWRKTCRDRAPLDDE